MGGTVGVRNTEWDGTVAPGGSASFEFTATDSSSAAPHTLTCARP
ncbi:cellulose binding domain-containing protein [Streptomyces capillispiralis]|nr:cellulose binding domain-containing protein [Streptomyces capillispiralis]